MTPRGVYLDHAASWPPDPRLLAAHRAAAERAWAATEGLHGWAETAAATLEEARAGIGALVGAEPDDVILCGGPSEARSLGIKGALGGIGQAEGLVLTTAAEHPAGLAVARSVNRRRGGPRLVGVDGVGRVDPADLGAATDADVALVSVTLAQPEIGTIQDVAGLVAAVRERRPDVLVHLDATDSAGLVQVDMRGWGVDLVSLGGVPLGAPAWTGALVARPGVLLAPLVEGGAQERGKRAGAQDAPDAVVLGMAAGLALAERDARIASMGASATLLADRLLAVGDVRLNGPREGRLPGNVHVGAAWVDGESLALALAVEGVAVSPGSACTAAAGKAAPILEAIGLDARWTRSGVLLSTGPGTTTDEIEVAAAAFARCVARLRAISPVTAET